MRSGVSVRLLTVAVAVCAAGGIGIAAPASACACGGVVTGSANDTATVNNEVALLGWDGRRETILMQLSLQAGTDNAALIVPTPTPATVGAGRADTFAELEKLTAPEVVTDRKWFGSDTDGMGAAPGGANTAPTVLDQVRLGPLEATTLAGGDLTGVQKWLGDNGYVMRPEVTATLEPYLSEGWSFVAMRLTSSEPLRGALDPVKLTFDSDRLVYPMRMSRAATQAQTVHLYVLGAHQVERSDGDEGEQRTTLQFAGRIDPTDTDLRELGGNGRDYLTEMSVYIGQPESIDADFVLANREDVDYRQRVHRTEYVEFFGVPAGFIVVGAALIAVAGAVVAALALFVRAVRRKPTG